MLIMLLLRLSVRKYSETFYFPQQISLSLTTTSEISYISKRFRIIAYSESCPLACFVAVDIPMLYHIFFTNLFKSIIFVENSILSTEKYSLIVTSPSNFQVGVPWTPKARGRTDTACLLHVNDYRPGLCGQR